MEQNISHHPPSIFISPGVPPWVKTYKSKASSSSVLDALTSSRETIVQNNLFFFISSTKSALDGKIVSIDPSSSNVADVLKKYGANIDGRVFDDISGGTLEMYRNGVIISMDEELCNGDVLTLPHFIIDYLIF